MGREPTIFERARYFFARAIKKLRVSAVWMSDVHPTSVVEGSCQIVRVKMGRHSFCGYDCTILNAEIGAFCSIADHVYIGGAGHPVHFASTSPVFLAHRDSVRTKLAQHRFEHQPRTVIGNDVWIGFGARIRAGVKIGDGSIVGMGSVVTRDVEPYTIVAGNPAKVIKRRFSVEVSQALLELKWWEMMDKDLRENGHLFTSPTDLLKKLGAK